MRRGLVVALVSLGVAGGAVSGCSSSGPPIVDKTDLQASITKLFHEPPKSVTCRDDLVGEVGRSTQCEVEGSTPLASLTPIVTVTSVDGERGVNWQLDPAMSQKLVETIVAGQVEQHLGVAADRVSCESGLEGKKDSFTHCDFDAGGETLRRTATVTNVENMNMRLVLLPVVARTELEELLINDIAQELGERPAATCSGDLDAVPGYTVNCTVTLGPETRDWRFIVTSLDGDQIHYEYEPSG